MHQRRARGATERHGIVLLAGLTLVALLTRLYGLWSWDIAYDEYFTFFEAQTRYSTWQNPAYYALVAIAYWVFGQSELVARLPAFLIGVASIPIFFVTWRNVLGTRSAAMASVLIILSTWHLWYSQFSRFYSGVFLCGSLAFYAYYVALRSDRLSALCWSLVASAVGVLFHFTFLLQILACAVLSGLLAVWASLRGEGYSRRIAVWYLTITGAGLLVFAPMAWDQAVQWTAKGQFWGYGPAGALLALGKWTQLPIAACALAGCGVLLAQGRRFSLLIIIGAGVPVGFYLIGAAFTTVRPEYVFYSLPLVFLVAGHFCTVTGEALADSLQRVASRGSGAQTFITRWVSYSVVFVVAVSMMPEFLSYYMGRATLHLRQPARVLEAAYAPGDRVLALVNLYNAFRYYARMDYPEEPILGDPLDAAVDWPAQLRPYSSQEGCVWMLLPVRRQPLAPGLEQWLLENAALVWRQTSVRFDYKIEGYQIFVTGRDYLACRRRAVEQMRSGATTPWFGSGPPAPHPKGLLNPHTSAPPRREPHRHSCPS